MDVKLRVGDFEAAAQVRRAVFMDEQGYVDEFDGIDRDASCVHVALLVDGEPVACGRVFPEPVSRALAPGEPVAPACELDAGVAPGEVWLLGRIAVLPSFRGRGLAKRAIAACERAARDAGARMIKLHSQEHARGLYEACGCVAISAVDLEDEGQPHLWMAKLL